MSAPPPMHSYICSSVWHCVYCNQIISVPTPCLECGHALVNIFMPMSVPIILHNLCLVTWNMDVTGWQIMCFALIPLLYLHQYMNYVHLTAHVCSTSFEQFHENMDTSVWHCVFVTINLFLVTHLC